MIPDFSREKIPDRILIGLSKEGPSPLTKIYGFCGARHGGDQHLVRQAVKQLLMNSKLRLEGAETYSIKEKVQVPEEPEPPPVKPEPDPDPEPEPYLASSDEVEETEGGAGEVIQDDQPKRPQAKRGAFRGWILAKLADQPNQVFAVGELLEAAVEAGVTVSRSAGQQAVFKMVQTGDLERVRNGYVRLPAQNTATVTEDQIEEPPAPLPDIPSDGDAQVPQEEEIEEMQTQTNGSNGRPKPLKDFIINLLSGSGEAMSVEQVVKAAIKKGVTKSKGSVTETLRKLALDKAITKPETGLYAGGKVIYDASKKRTAADVKRVAEGKKTVAAAKPAKRKRVAAAKPGRKPSPMRGIYDQLDAKIEAARKADDQACEGIREIDEQVKKLGTRRAELVATRDKSRATVKKLRDGRKKIAALEAGVSAIFKD